MKADEASMRRQDCKHDHSRVRKAENETKHELKKMEARVSAAQKKVQEAHDQLRVQISKVVGLREQVRTMLDADTLTVVQQQLDEQHELNRIANVEMAELQDELDVAQEALAEATAGSGSGAFHEANASKYFDQMRTDCGVKHGRVSVPPRSSESAVSKRRSVRHMAAVIADRGNGTDIHLVCQALERCGYLEKLVEAPRFQQHVKQIVRTATDAIQSHWSARHGVQVWDRLELSRSQMETLHHLLSFVYNPSNDKYEPIRVWTNPNDKSDVVLCARLASRGAREKLFREMADGMGIVVGSTGRCERDAIKCTSLLYSTYSKALRQEYSIERPAQPILFLDGTGAGFKGICHGEMGCADFIAVGDSDARQSRHTLQPLFLYNGSDHSQDLRSNIDLAITSYNQLVKVGYIDRYYEMSNGESVTERIPTRCMTAADMQGAKSTYGMKLQSHSVWCKCQRGEGGPQHQYPKQPVNSYVEMLEYIEKTVGCQIKTFDEICSWAHYSPGVARGCAFTPFTCSCCGYCPSKSQWEKDLSAWHKLDDDERAAAQDEHEGKTDDMKTTRRHYYQMLFTPPLPHHGMERCGVDDLHLVFLNHFKHLFKHTIHHCLPTSKKKLVRAYIEKAGFYSYNAASTDEDPVAHWIRREVKKFLVEAHIHLPFLLRLASAPPDIIPEFAASLNVEGEMSMDDDDEYAPTPEEVAQEENEEPLMMRNADRWQHFLDLVASRSVPWPQGVQDTDEYRQGRAVEAFNLGSVCANDLLDLKPTMETWVPHILVFIVPRQMVYLGDPMRRSCDACESFGAMVKKTIKHLTCRRRLKDEATVHEGKRLAGGANGKRWRQTFTRGYVDQTFRRITVSESLRHGMENEPFLQRADHRRLATGKTHIQPKKFANDSPAIGIRSAIEQEATEASAQAEQ